MRAVVVREQGPAENLQLAEFPRPTAGAGRVVVRVGAAGVNPVDATNRADPSWAGIEPPYVVGYQFAGWIEEVGPGVAGFARGDAVWGMCPVRGTRWGTYADYVELEAGWVGPRPATLDVAEAAAIPLTGSTALQLLDRLALQIGRRGARAWREWRRGTPVRAARADARHPCRGVVKQGAAPALA